MEYRKLPRGGEKTPCSRYISEITPEESVGKCGHCNSRCPFQVKQQERMEEIKDYFGM